MKIRPLSLTAIVVTAFLRVAPVASADNYVIVNSVADEKYSRQKFGEDRPKAESYVVMPGNFYAGFTVDRSLERMSFRQVASMLAPELARNEYWPSRSVEGADLLLVIHWGVTTPSVSSTEMLARTNPVADVTNTHDGMAQSIRSEGVGAATDLLGALGDSANLNAAYANDVLLQQTDVDGSARSNTAQLLGYTAALKRYKTSLMPSLSELSLVQSLEEERYFVVVKAYDLRQWKKGENNRSLWTIRLNISSPGNNFKMAMERMSLAGVDFFGRSSGDILTVRAKPREGHVTLAPLVILGEEK